MSFRLRWPTEFDRLVEPFGEQPGGNEESGLRGHEGLDFFAPNGSKVFACAEGHVIRIEMDVNKGRKKVPSGHQVHISHYVDGHEYTTVYSHLQQIRVALHDFVNRGDWIGSIESTGHAASAHLHLTLKKKGATKKGETSHPADIIDPTGFLDPFSNFAEVPSAQVDELKDVQDVTSSVNSIGTPVTEPQEKSMESSLIDLSLLDNSFTSASSALSADIADQGEEVISVFDNISKANIQYEQKHSRQTLIDTALAELEQGNSDEKANISSNEPGARGQNDVSEFINSLLHQNEFLRSLHFLNYVLLSPVKRTMELVDKGWSPAGNPFTFMEFGIAASTLIYGILSLSSDQFDSVNLFQERYEFLEGVITNLLFVLTTLIGGACSFYVIKAITKSNREFKHYLRVTAVIIGLQSVIFSLVLLSSIFLSERLFIGLFLVSSIYFAIITFQIYRRFWKLSFWRLIAYGFISLVPTTILLMIIFTLFVRFFGPIMRG